MADTALTGSRSGSPDRPAIQKIMALQGALFDGIASGDFEPADLPLEHFWPKGMYARKIFMPAGSTVVSKVHKSEHLTVVMSGSATVTSEDGIKKVIEAPQVFVTYPGTKRALFIHEDSVWLTVHRCESRDLEGAESELIQPDGSEEEILKLSMEGAS